VRFEVLKAMSVKMAVFWDVAPCSLVDIDRRFIGAYCLHYRAASQKTDVCRQRRIFEWIEI
jgi:hypothetical protein